MTSHVFGMTVATLMGQAGLFWCAAVDQLGHANTSMTSDVYFGRKIAAIGAAAVLRALSSYARSSLAPVRHLNTVGLDR